MMSRRDLCFCLCHLVVHDLHDLRDRHGHEKIQKA
jgi:hypothetical protein